MDHERIVQHIYDCAAEDSGFAGALVSIGRTLEAAGGHLLVLDAHGQLAQSHFFGHDESSFADYETRWRDKDPRFAAANGQIGRVLSDVEVVDRDLFERSEIYNELLRPHDARYTLFGQFRLGGNSIAALAFLRPRLAGSFDEGEVRHLTRLVPHLRRALDLHLLVQSLEDKLHDLRAALDLMPAAVAILDAAGRVQCANAAAERLLTSKDGLRLDDQLLTAERASTAEAIRAALARTATFAEGSARGAGAPTLPTAVEVERQRGRPLGLVFLPLRPRNVLRHDGHARARVAVVFHDPEASVRLDPALIGQLHKLTPTEALLAASIAQGRSLADFARERGCSEQTARTHLKRVLDKTETRRQAELVRLVLGSAALHLMRR